MISEATTSRELAPAEVLDVIAGAFVDPPVAPTRAGAQYQDGSAIRSLLAMPALRPHGIATVKVVNAGPGRLNSHLLAFDRLGALLAVVEAHGLTALRTAAASVLAAKAIGAGSATRLSVLGAGRQGRAHIEAFAAALPIEEVTIWARRDEAARQMASFAAQHVATVRIAASPAEAAANGEIVSCATPATSPLLTGQMVSRAHIDLVGGFRPDMREADDTLIASAAIVADTFAALVEAGDLVQPIAAGIIADGDVILLADILTGKVPAPRSELTVFKSVGHAAEDLVVMELLLGKLGVLADVRTAPQELEKVASNV